MAGVGDPSGLTFRQDYFDDPRGWEALVSLLQDIFDIDIGPLQRLGGPDPSSMPFGWFAADGVLAANISAFALPLVVNGQRLHAAGLQSGAVRPAWRGRGLYRDVTRKALDWCDGEGFEAVVLYTDKPALYEPYGFRSLPMHCHSGPAPAPADGGACERRLDRDADDDISLLRSVLARRAPVSKALAVVSNAAMFLINMHLDPDVRVSWLSQQQAAVAWKIDEAGHFSLLDVVAEEIPSLDAILGGLGIRPSIADSLFCPDKLGWTADARPWSSSTHFMVRSRQAIDLACPAMLSPMADF